MVIHISFKFHEILFVGDLVMALFVILKQLKSNNSCITEAIVTILIMQIHVMVIHIHYKCHEILFLGYLVMDQSFVDFKSIQGQ